MTIGQASWKGSAGSINGSTTGTNTPTIPTHAIGDTLWVVAEGDVATWGTDPSGWTPVASSAFTTISKAKIWKRIATSTTENVDHPPTISPTSANHVGAVAFVTENVHATKGIHQLTISQTLATTAPVMPSVKTLVDGCLILNLGFYSLSNAGPICSAQANTTVTPTDRFNGGVTSGNGGGVQIYSAELANAGEFANTTFTCTSTGWIFVTIALAPAASEDATDTVTIAGSPAADGGQVMVYDKTQPEASGLVATTTTTGGSFTVHVPYDDHEYIVVFGNGSSYGASPPDTV